MKNLDKFFSPNSVAVIGASNDLEKVGGHIFFNVKKSLGKKAYPVNIKGKKVQGIKAYSNITDIPFKVDLAIIAIPASLVIDEIKNCLSKNIKNYLIISAGFKEIGETGIKREEALNNIIKEHGINVVGPNCLGTLEVNSGYNLSFAKELPEIGGVSLISQSGAVIDALIDWSFKSKIGFSKIISLGNRSDVDEVDILNYLKNDPKTKVITLYLESLNDGISFAKTLKEVSKIKPVVIIKPGSSELTRKAIGSHTGSLAKDQDLVTTLIKENNGILVKTLDELFNILTVLKSKKVTSNKLAIITNAGGLGVMATDQLINTNFNLYQLTKNEKKQFKFLPTAASLNNPIDILGDADSLRYTSTLEKLIKIKDIGSILIMLTPQVMTDSLEIAKGIVKLSKKTNKNIVCSFVGYRQVKSAVQYLNDNNVACVTTPSQAITALNYLYNYSSFKSENIKALRVNLKKVSSVRKSLKNYHGLLDYSKTKKIISLLGIKLQNKKILKQGQDIKKIKLVKNKKYVLKIDSKQAIHKNRLGGLVLNIDNNNFRLEALKLFKKFKKFKDLSLILEDEVKGQEIIIGLKRSQGLGEFLMFGSGGSDVEKINEVNWTLCPVSLKKAQDLVKNSTNYTLLKNKSIDFKKLYQLIVKISYLLELIPEIKEVDLNPVICSREKLYLADIKLII
ncbi:hypothetical protein HOG11_00945 [bacterium]|nr:hypothetical protein [bacterium]